MKIDFRPELHSLGRVEMDTPTIAEMDSEPSLFSCDMEHAGDLGGSITRKILAKIKRSSFYKNRRRSLYTVVDVRVQRLMPGMYPSIPGWHCDSVPRDDYYSQPDFSRIPSGQRHFACVVGTDEESAVAPTEFVESALEVDIDPKRVWNSLHDELEKIKPSTRVAKNRELLVFNSLCPHRATPCVVRGWRLFFRLSLLDRPPIGNRISTSNQVYLLSESNGW